MEKGSQGFLRLGQAELRKLQMELYDILVEFDRICRGLDLPYYLAYGTLLGSIRHQGFIPWDDDVDVWMMRKDYEAFCRCCQKELDNEKFFFQDAKSDPHYYWTYGKMRKKNTVYIRVGQNHMKQKTGICIDIIPIDNLPKDKRLADLSQKICGKCKRLLWAHAGRKAADTRKKRLQYSLQALLPKRLLHGIFHFFACIEKDDMSTDLVVYCLKYRVFKHEYFEERIDKPFEGHEMSVPAGYDCVLAQLYKQYMEYPAEDKRHGSAFASRIVFSDGTEIGRDKNCFLHMGEEKHGKN